MALDETLRIALRMLRLGLSIIPVWPPGDGHDGKTPAIAWTEYQTRRPTEAELRRWFGGAPMNIGIVTGAVSGVVAIDADLPEALRSLLRERRLPHTPWQTKTARGFHLFYAHPGISVRNRARIETPGGRVAIDVRADGGYVVGPGSLHASGARYALAGDWSQPKDSLPRFWVGWLARPTRPSSPSAAPTRPTGDVVERARRYLAAIPVPQIGHGSDVATLSVACRLVRGFALSPADAEALLWAWCGGRPGWTRDWIAAKVRHAERYGSESIGALR